MTLLTYSNSWDIHEDTPTAIIYCSFIIAWLALFIRIIILAQWFALTNVSVWYVDTNKLLDINCPKQMIGEIVIFVCLAWAVGTRIFIHTVWSKSLDGIKPINSSLYNLYFRKILQQVYFIFKSQLFCMVILMCFIYS